MISAYWQRLTAMENICGAGTMTKPYNFDAAATKNTLVINNSRMN